LQFDPHDDALSIALGARHIDDDFLGLVVLAAEFAVDGAMEGGYTPPSDA